MEIERSAPGKVILCGEHSVVYGYPAVAVPVSGLRTWTYIISQNESKGLQIFAPDIRKNFYLSDAQIENPIAKPIRMVLDIFKCTEPDARLTIKSQLPIGSGMGSGAAVTVSIIKALSAYLEIELDNNTISDLTFEIEKIYHGSPSGIDNAVITWERPIYFIKGQPIDFCKIGKPVHLLIASSGISTFTLEAVAEVQARRSANAPYYDGIFQRIGDLTNAARQAVAEGDLLTLGTILRENHGLLMDLGVSIPQLDIMVDTALQAGALGAKLTGSGYGGNIIAVVDPSRIDNVRNALFTVGCTNVWLTCVTDVQNNSISHSNLMSKAI